MILFIQCLMVEVKIVINFWEKAGSEWPKIWGCRVLIIFCCLIWVLITWGSSLCQNSLNCMRMICVVFVYINTNLKIQENISKHSFGCATRWWSEFMDFFVYRHWSWLLCSCLKVWETGLPGSQEPSWGRLHEMPSLLFSVNLPGWEHLSAWYTRKIINHLHLWFCQ